MKTSDVLKLLGAMVVVSGVTAAVTFKVMENSRMGGLAQDDSSISLTPAGSQITISRVQPKRRSMPLSASPTSRYARPSRSVV